MLVRAAGHLCVTVLRVLRSIPPAVLEPSLGLALPLYPLLRPGHTHRLRQAMAALPATATPVISASAPFSHAAASNMDIGRYYRMRLRLSLRSLRQHGRALAADSVIASGQDSYQRALASDRPVALIGLHAGLLELLHRVPGTPAGKPFLILTAPAFAPALSTFMARGRKRDGKTVLWNRPSGNPGASMGQNFTAGLREIIQSKGVLALMADQHPGAESDAEYLDLWDRLRVPYPARLLRFLVEKDFLFVPVSTSLRPDGKSDFRFHEALDPVDMPSRLREFLETAISAAPDQWNWSYPKVRAVEVPMTTPAARSKA